MVFITSIKSNISFYGHSINIINCDFPTCFQLNTLNKPLVFKLPIMSKNVYSFSAEKGFPSFVKDI